jgi:hypothetical protein
MQKRQRGCMDEGRGERHGWGPKAVHTLLPRPPCVCVRKTHHQIACWERRRGWRLKGCKGGPPGLRGCCCIHALGTIQNHPWCQSAGRV